MVLGDPWESHLILPPPPTSNLQTKSCWFGGTVAIILCGGRGCVQHQQGIDFSSLRGSWVRTELASVEAQELYIHDTKSSSSQVPVLPSLWGSMRAFLHQAKICTRGHLGFPNLRPLWFLIAHRQWLQSRHLIEQSLLHEFDQAEAWEEAVSLYSKWSHSTVSVNLSSSFKTVSLDQWLNVHLDSWLWEQSLKIIYPFVQFIFCAVQT